jgi:proline iminopeptidase
MQNWNRFVCLLVVGFMAACSPQQPGAPQVETPAGPENGSFTADLNGFKIHYEVHGQGPVLMTVPNSWGLSLEGLRALYRPLMVYFDPRGMGESDPIREEADMGLAAVRADFDALRRHLGVEKVHAIGWSNGAMNLILLAAEKSDILSSAIFVHGVASFTEEDMKEWLARHADLASLYQSFNEEMANPDMPVAEKTARLRDFWFKDVFPSSTADPESATEMLEELFREAQFSWPHADYSNREVPMFDARDKLPSIRVRSLVIAGAHDALMPDKVRVLHDGLTDSRFVVFEQSGHFAQVEEPEAFKAEVYAFLGVD